MTSLPWLGLGLSSNLGERDLPHPYRLLDREPGLFDFVEYSAPLELPRARAEADLFAELWERRGQIPVLFHPVHLNLFGPQLEPAERLAALEAHAKEVGSPWVGNDVAWWHTGEQAFPGFLYLSPPLTRASVDACAVHALHVQSALSVPLALENPAVIARRGQLHVLDFMAQLHARTGRPLVLDVGHLWSHQLSARLPLAAGFDGFPFDQVIELHIAGGVATGSGEARFYADDHTQPIHEELFELLAEVLPRCTGLRALTYEGDGHPGLLASRMLRRIRAMLPAPAASLPPPPPALAPPDAGPVDLGAGAAELFARAFATPLPPRPGAPAEVGLEVEAEQAERSWRLSVLADQLERDWPLTRWLAAPTFEELQRFVADRRFAAVFLEGKGTVADAFGAWARGEVLRTRKEAAIAALSLESWAHTVLAQPVPARTEGGQVSDGLRLGPKTAVGTFPADLTELVFGVASLKRHLQARALTGERPGAAAFGALRAAATVGAGGGAAPGPWPLAVRADRGRLELVPLTAAQARVLVAVSRSGAPLPPHPNQAERAAVDELLAAGLLTRG